MSTWAWIAVGVGATLVLYAGFVVALVLAGRRTDARAVAGFVPDCVVLLRRLLADPRVPRARKLLVPLAIAYLALPFDLVPDFIPVAGYLDDAVVVALVLRHLLRTSGPDLIHEHWPGSPGALAVILRLAGHHHAAASAPEELGDRARVRLLPSPAGRGDVNLTPQGRVVSAAGESPTRRPTDR